MNNEASLDIERQLNICLLMIACEFVIDRMTQYLYKAISVYFFFFFFFFFFYSVLIELWIYIWHIRNESVESKYTQIIA